MSWIADNELNYFQQFCVNVIKCGPVPQHVAFIMDGNRRYATKTHIQKTEGHSRGFDKLSQTLQWCLELGIKEVTVYAFSIENFKRSQDEVDTLMRLAREKFEKLLEEKDRIMLEGVCIRVIGNLKLLSPELRRLIAKAMLMTKHNNRAFLNVAFAYTSREEITSTVETITNGVENGLLEVSDVDEDLISSCLYTNLSPNPDLIVRTSGEVRFSDFLLWQISMAHVCFTQVLWPEFCIWHLLACVFKYQRSYFTLQKVRHKTEKLDKSDRVHKFIEKLKEERLEELQNYLNY